MSRVLVDTNVFISALLFPNSTPARALALVIEHHRLVLCQWVLDELWSVVGRKRPDLLPAVEELLEALDFELAEPGGSPILIADPDDQPILDAALAASVDMIITGDRHFFALGHGGPQVMTARGFLDAMAIARPDP